MPSQESHYHKRAVAYFWCALFLIFADGLFTTRLITTAAVAYTPYANSVASSSGVAVGDTNNAIGAPDGQTTNLVSVNSSLTLDMGSGEEGTQTLKIYLGKVGPNEQVNIAFLDSNQIVLRQENRDLFFSPAATTATFGFDWRDYSQAYRFVRLTSLGGGGLDLDAIEALGFIGSTSAQDTDGDSLPDRQDSQPLVFNPQTNPASNTAAAALPHSSSHPIVKANSTQVNAPAAGSEDSDGDQIPNKWESDHGLGPDNKADGKTDLDHDGLNNLQEYQAGTDPQKLDSDGDGIPDGWEFKHGLNPLKNDAPEDQDGDYLNNLGEYHFGTNPFRADKLSVNGGVIRGVDEQRGDRLSDADWLVFYLLLSAAVLSCSTGLVLAAAASPSSSSSKFYRLRHRLYKAFRPRTQPSKPTK